MNALNISMVTDQVNEIKTLLRCPRLFIAENFAGLINQLDQEFNLSIEKTNNSTTSSDKKEEIIDSHLTTISYIKDKEAVILNSISSNFSFETSFEGSILNSIKNYETSLNGQILSNEKLEEFENIFYNYLIEIQRVLFGDKCFI